MTTTITGATGIDNIQASTGAVLQVVSTTESIEYSTTTSDFTARATGLSATITPSSVNSKVLVTVNTMIAFQYNNTFGKAALYRSISGGASTNNLTGESYGFILAGNGVTHAPISFSYSDSPSSTAAITYSPTFGYALGGAGIVYLGGGSISSTITVQEIAG